MAEGVILYVLIGCGFAAWNYADAVWWDISDDDCRRMVSHIKMDRRSEWQRTLASSRVGMALIFGIWWPIAILVWFESRDPR